MGKIRVITEKDTLAEEFFKLKLFETPQETLRKSIREIVAKAAENKTPKKEINRQFNLAVNETSTMLVPNGERKEFRINMKALFENTLSEIKSKNA